MNRRTVLVLLAALLTIALRVVIGANQVNVVGPSTQAAQAAEVEETTVPEPSSTVQRTPKTLVGMAADAIAAPAATTTSAPKPTTTTQLPPTTTTRPAPATTVASTVPAVATSSVRASCSELDINLAAATLTAHCTDGDTRMSVSSGSGEWYFNPATGEQDKADTPTGHFSVYAMDPGWVKAPLGWMYNSMYFLRGFAVHGDPLVPSHGCVHVIESRADWLFARVYVGTLVNIA